MCSIRGWFRGLRRRFYALFPVKLMIVEGDLFPGRIPKRRLVLLDDDGPYAAAMLCPCGCREVIELMVMEGVSPRWDVWVDDRSRPTLRPSIWRQSGCRSHFWVRGGRVIWCKSG